MDYFKGKNQWFDKNYADKITPEFAEWWSGFYGEPDNFVDQSEYFVRMAMAWHGWTRTTTTINTLRAEEKGILPEPINFEEYFWHYSPEIKKV
jgi:hypothetical protein